MLAAFDVRKQVRINAMYLPIRLNNLLRFFSSLSMVPTILIP